MLQEKELHMTWMSLTNVTLSKEARQKNEYCIFNLQVQKQFKWQLSKSHWWLPLGESDLAPTRKIKEISGVLDMFYLYLNLGDDSWI